MSRNVKTLIAGIAVIAVLSGGIAALKLTEPDSSATDSESAAETQADEHTEVYNSESGVKSLEVTNSHGSYTIEKTKDADGDNEAQYSIDELEDLPLNTDIVNSLPVSLSSLEAEKLIDENISDLSQYGLEKPETKVKVSFDDGSEKTICIGNDTPSGDIYMCLDGENTVYAITSDTFSLFRYDTDYYISLVCLEAPETNDDYPIVNYLEINRKDLDYPIRFEYDSKSADTDYSGGTASTHVMTSPVFAYIDIGEGSTTVTHGLFGLTAYSAATVRPSDDEISFAGLDDPFCTVTMDTDDGYTRTLKIGNTMNINDTEYYLGMFDDIDIIYCFSKDDLPWVDMQPLDIASKLIFGTYFYDIGTMTVKADGHETLVFTTEGTDSDDFSVKLNGDDYDVERFQNFYKYLLNAQAEEIYTQEPDENDLICSVEIKRNDEFEDETVEFYKGDGKSVIIKHNGVTSFINKVNYDYINVLLDNIDKVQTDEDFSMTWK